MEEGKNITILLHHDNQQQAMEEEEKPRLGSFLQV
jgi:hypothetical protein